MKSRRRRACAPPGEPVEVEMVATPDEGKIAIRFLGPVRGIHVHWSKTDSCACVGEGECPTGWHRQRTYWKGYAPIEWWREGQYQDWASAVLEVTERAWQKLEGAELRGSLWKFWRFTNQSQKKEVTCEPLGSVDPDTLPAPFSVEPCVCRVYRSVRIQFDLAPLLPKTVFRPPSVGAPPPKYNEVGGNAPVPLANPYEQILAGLRAGKLDPKLAEAFPKQVLKAKAELEAERGKTSPPSSKPNFGRPDKPG